MKKNVKINGQLKSFLRWPAFLSILLVIMTICMFFIDIKAGFVMACFLGVYVAVVAILYFTLHQVIVNELIEFAMEYAQVQKNLVKELRIPYGIADTSGNILWGNELLKEIFGDKIVGKTVNSYFAEVTREDLPADDTVSIISVNYGEKDYRMEMTRVIMETMADKKPLVEMGGEDNALIALYLFDETDIKKYIKENQEQKLVCGMIIIDNYEEALSSTEDVRRSLLAALIDRKITKYMQSFDAIVNKMEKDRFLFVVRQKFIPQMQSTKFSILDEVREINIGNEIPITLCIGIGMNAASYTQSAEWARSAIDLALGRGGDQAVVKDRDKISYYGGKTKQVEKGTRVRARVKAHALAQLISGKERVVIMGHKISDVDSFGAAIGVYRAARTLNKKAHIVINDITTTVKPMMDRFIDNSDYDGDMFLKSSDAGEIVDLNTVLVVVDVNRPSYTEGPELLKLTKTTVVIDHHRSSSEGIESPVLSYIEPFASSACEMVAEILQYIGDGVRLKQAEADAMYAGLMIDTNNFLSKTGVRTFEAAAFLKRSGADVTKVRMALRDDMKTYKARAEAVRTATVSGDMAFAVCPSEGLISPTVVGAQAANELLNITGIRASFVFTQVNQTIFISARSFEGGMNVQLVMERLGGGGHGTVAGAQLEDVSVEDAMQKTKDVLDTMFREGDI